MAEITIPDWLYNRLRGHAYDTDQAADELITAVLAEALPTLKQRTPPKSKAAMMADLRERRRQERYGADWRTRVCEWCSTPIGDVKNPNATYCSGACRQAAYRARTR